MLRASVAFSVQLRERRSRGRRSLAIWLTAFMIAGGCFSVTLCIAGSTGCRFPSANRSAVVRGAAQLWQLSQRSAACPDVTELIGSTVMDDAFVEEVRPGMIRIRCTSDDIYVHWAGPDSAFDTQDDQKAPTGR